MTIAFLRRTFVLAASAVLCAFAAGFVALYVQGKFLPPTDGAYGQSLSDTISDPFVLLVWWPFIAVGACIGFVFSALLLWDVRLSRAIPIVAAVTIAAVALTSMVLMPLSPLVGLVAGAISMESCHRRPKWRINAPA